MIADANLNWWWAKCEWQWHAKLASRRAWFASQYQNEVASTVVVAVAVDGNKEFFFLLFLSIVRFVHSSVFAIYVRSAISFWHVGIKIDVSSRFLYAKAKALAAALEWVDRICIQFFAWAENGDCVRFDVDFSGGMLDSPFCKILSQNKWKCVYKSDINSQSHIVFRIYIYLSFKKLPQHKQHTHIHTIRASFFRFPLEGFFSGEQISLLCSYTFLFSFIIDRKWHFVVICFVMLEIVYGNVRASFFLYKRLSWIHIKYLQWNLFWYFVSIFYPTHTHTKVSFFSKNNRPFRSELPLFHSIRYFVYYSMKFTHDELHNVALFIFIFFSLLFWRSDEGSHSTKKFHSLKI